MDSPPSWGRLAGESQCQKHHDVTLGICELLGSAIGRREMRGSLHLHRIPCFSLRHSAHDNLTTSSQAVAPSGAHCIMEVSYLLHLDSLIGQLQHARAVVKPGRSFLCHMIVLSKSRKHPSHYLCLNRGFRAGLFWWYMFASL